MMIRKTKPLRPSLREKKRYVVFDVISDTIINLDNISIAIKDKLKEFIGIKGSGDAGIIFINNKWDNDKQRGIIKVNNKYVDELKATFSLTKKVNAIDVLVRTLGVSGSIKKAQLKFMNQ